MVADWAEWIEPEQQWKPVSVTTTSSGHAHVDKAEYARPSWSFVGMGHRLCPQDRFTSLVPARRHDLRMPELLHIRRHENLTRGRLIKSRTESLPMRLQEDFLCFCKNLPVLCARFLVGSKYLGPKVYAVGTYRYPHGFLL